MIVGTSSISKFGPGKLQIPKMTPYIVPRELFLPQNVIEGRDDVIETVLLFDQVDVVIGGATSAHAVMWIYSGSSEISNEEAADGHFVRSKFIIDGRWCCRWR